MCDLDLGDRDQIVALCTSPDNGDYLYQLISKYFQWNSSYGADTKFRLKPLIFKKYNLDLGDRGPNCCVSSAVNTR